MANSWLASEVLSYSNIPFSVLVRVTTLNSWALIVLFDNDLLYPSAVNRIEDIELSSQSEIVIVPSLASDNTNCPASFFVITKSFSLKPLIVSLPSTSVAVNVC